MEDVHNLINFGPTNPIQILNQHEILTAVSIFDKMWFVHIPNTTSTISVCTLKILGRPTQKIFTYKLWVQNDKKCEYMFMINLISHVKFNDGFMFTKLITFAPIETKMTINTETVSVFENLNNHIR